MKLRDLLIYTVVGVAVVIGYIQYQDFQAQETAKAKKQSETDKAAAAESAKFIQQIDAVCLREAERVLATVYNSRILDRHGSSGGFGTAAAETSTGWRRHYSATVSGQSKRFFGTCFVDKGLRLIDFKHTFE